MINDRTDKNSYLFYSSWCAENGKVPINADDFAAKIEFLKKHLYGKKALREYINEAAEIWND